MLDLSAILPRDQHALLRHAYRSKWWKIVPEGTAVALKFDSKLVVTNEDRMAYWLLSNASKLGRANAALRSLGFGCLLHHGPKMFRATYGQCQSMSHIEPRISVGEYSQPYEAMLVQYNPAWVAEQGEPPDDIKAMTHTLLWRHESGLVMSALIGPQDTGITCFYFPWGRSKTLEEVLALPHPDQIEGDATYSIPFQRVALNFALLAVYLGTGSTRWVDPKLRRKHERLKDERGELLRMGDMQIVELAQQIELVRHERESHAGTGEGPARGPHWRRGHWRNQACGPGLSQRKLILVPPVMVHAERFAPNAQTNTDYKPMKAPWIR